MRFHLLDKNILRANKNPIEKQEEKCKFRQEFENLGKEPHFFMSLSSSGRFYPLEVESTLSPDSADVMVQKYHEANPTAAK